MVPSYVRFGETFDDTRQLDGFPLVSVDVGKGLLEVRQFSWLNGRHRQPTPSTRDYSRHYILEMMILCFKKRFSRVFRKNRNTESTGSSLVLTQRRVQAIRKPEGINLLFPSFHLVLTFPRGLPASQV